VKKAKAYFPAVPGWRKIQILGVRNRLGLSQEELARVTGYSVRAIANWEAGKKLSGAARQKVVETERLRAALAEIVPAADLGTWMRTPNPAFAGQTPIQVIERGETDRIWRMIIQIDAGVAN
jgi:transcriptional regulator with XRE-family HTH domain